MYLSHLKFKGHPVLKDLSLNLANPKTGKPYSIVAFVGENACGKTTILKQLFDYKSSEYIVEKESDDINSLFLRQGSVYSNSMREIRKLIDGKDIYENKSFSNPVRGHIYPLDNGKQKQSFYESGNELIDCLKDEDIKKIFKENLFKQLKCSQDIAKVINGDESGYNITSFSSGQQEIILKIKDLETMPPSIDLVLLDEPETSLHPRWQRRIVELMRNFTNDGNGNYPQMFLATHSEKVLESLISRDDTLIIRLFKENGIIKAETISQMNLCLPSPTFAELDFVIFHIPSLDYHDQLLSRFAELNELDSIWELDKAIKSSNKYNSNEYKKIWIAETKKGGIVTYKTLPVYIRNYFHHPKKDKAPTEEELVKSIIFMRELVSTNKD